MGALQPCWHEAGNAGHSDVLALLAGWRSCGWQRALQRSVSAPPTKVRSPMRNVVVC